MEKDIVSEVEVQLLIEIRELKARLAQSEELLGAIRNGRGDAIVVNGSIGESIYSLNSAETSYRIFIEEMDEGAAMVTADGTIVYCNGQFANLLRLHPEKAAGINFTQIFDGHGKLKLEELLDLGKQIRINEEIKFSFPHAKDLYLQFSFFPMESGDTTNVCIIVSDIAEKKTAVEKVLEINQRFESGIEAAKMAWWEMDVKTGHILFHNRKAEMLGYPPEKFKHYTDFMALVHPADSEKLMDSMRNHIYGLADKYEGEYRILNSKGEYVWFSDVGRVIKKDQNGASLKVNGIVWDITKSKNFENVIKETAKRLELSLISSKAGTWDWDMISGTLFWSEQMFNLFGLDPNKTSASFDIWRTVMHPEDLEPAENRINQALEGHTLLNSDYRMIMPNGQIRWINATGEAIYDEEGKPVQMIGLCIDITERKQTESELKDSAKRFEALLTQAPSNGVIYRLIRDDAGKMVDWEISDINDQGASSIGLERETALGKRVLALFGEQVMAPYFEIARQVITSGIPQTFETYFEANDRHYLSSVFLLDPDHYANISIDITEHKRSEEKNAYQALILGNINEAVIASDENYKITHWNHAAELTYGWKAEEVLGKEGLHFTQSEYPDLSSEQVRKSIAELGLWKGEGTQMRKDGSRFAVEVSSFVLHDHNGRITGYVSLNRDITERKLSELMLKESENELRNLVSEMQVGVLIQGPKSEILLSNPKALELLGINEDQLLGKTSLDPDWNVIHEDGSPFPGNTHPVSLAIETQLPVTGVIMGVYNPRLRDRLWLLVDAMPLLNNDGTVRQVVCTFIDITKRKLAEEELIKAKKRAEESEERYKVLIDCIPNTSILLFDQDKRYFLVGGSEIEKSGFDKTFLVGHTLSEAYPPDVAELFSPIYDKALQGISTSIEHKYGEAYYHQQLMPIMVSVGVGQAGMVISTNITERILQQEKVNHLAAIVQSSEDAIIGKDLKGIITSWNQGAERLFGYRSKEMIGQPITKIIPIGRRSEEVEILHKISQGDRILNFETIRLTKNNQILDVSVTVSPILDSTGKIVGASKVVRDISERKRLIEELEVQNAELSQRNDELRIATGKAEESDRLKSAFLSNMSHEIRTPMNGIMGFTELLKDFDLTNEEQQQYILIIQKAGNRLLNIINDIIDISKIESGLMNVNISQSNINEQIEFIHSFFKTEVERKGMKLHYKTTLPEINAFIFTDREKLFAILTNLVKNAIKYSDRGSIEFGYHLVETHGRASILKFYVKDTGIGIPKDRQEAVFQRFIQADIVDKMARQGAGLGLTISKAYIEMLGGNISIESEEGVGSTFYFTLPYQTKLNGKNGIPHEILITSEEIQMKKLKILLVEDDKISRELLGRQVSMNGNEILEARTGLEAIDIFHANPDIDLILMDIQMPDMNGYEATRQIRQFDEKVVIIAQTAFAMGSEKKKAIDAGCTDYIAKPILKASLLGLINKYFKKEMNN